MKYNKTNLHLFFDIKDGELQIPVKFPSVSSLVDNYFDSIPGKTPFLSIKLFDQLNRLFQRIPLSMKMCLNVAITDSEGYTKEQVVSIFEVGINYYRDNVRDNVRKISVISAFMFATGCLMLALGYVLTPHLNHVLNDIIYISGTFFIWDAASRLLVGWLSQVNLLKKWRNLRINVEFASSVDLTPPTNNNTIPSDSGSNSLS